MLASLLLRLLVKLGPPIDIFYYAMSRCWDMLVKSVEQLYVKLGFHVRFDTAVFCNWFHEQVEH